MEEFRIEQNVSSIFKQADPARLYKTQLEELGVAVEDCVHTSRLRSDDYLPFQIGTALKLLAT